LWMWKTLSSWQHTSGGEPYLPTMLCTRMIVQQHIGSSQQCTHPSALLTTNAMLHYASLAHNLQSWYALAHNSAAQGYTAHGKVTRDVLLLHSAYCQLCRCCCCLCIAAGFARVGTLSRSLTPSSAQQGAPGWGP
jgi:hypothetical protein